MKLLQTHEQNKTGWFQNHTIAEIEEKNIAPPSSALAPVKLSVWLRA